VTHSHLPDPPGTDRGALEARGVEPDSTPWLKLMAVLGGAGALMVGTIILAVPLTAKDAKILRQAAIEAREYPQLAELRAREAELLGSYGRRDGGGYRMPIADGKKALLSNPALLGGLAPVAQAAEAPPAPDAAAAKSPEELAKEGDALFHGAKTCSACHNTTDVRLVGPGLKGLFGRQEKLADGSTVTVDESYVRESIKEPNAKVVEGFPPAMTPVPLTDAELDAIVAYLKTL
jgi:mono/diheme cytochrome c family protein